MKKYNTVLFKDDNDNFYIGETVKKKKNYYFKSFKGINSDSIKIEYKELKYNEFLLVTVEKKKTEYKITPFKKCELFDNIKKVPLLIYNMELEELIKMFNDGVPQIYLNPKQD